MEKEYNEEEENIKSVGGCGSEPIRPGSANPGNWDCQNGSWVWVENIGG